MTFLAFMKRDEIPASLARSVRRVALAFALGLVFLTLLIAEALRAGARDGAPPGVSIETPPH